MTDKYNNLKNDPDHKGFIKGKKDSEKKARPADTGAGLARRAADAISKRKQMLDEI